MQNAGFFIDKFNKILMRCNFAEKSDCLSWFMNCLFDYFDLVLESYRRNFTESFLAFSYDLLSLKDEGWSEEVSYV